jgi:catechol 2,3-dioxygenase-like lactoylglutathione lyase family enzyme
MSQPDAITEDLFADQAGRPESAPGSFRSEPTPSSTAPTPSPVSAPPTAPPPDRPFPSAPPPETARPEAPHSETAYPEAPRSETTRPDAPHPAGSIDDIDIPLDEPARDPGGDPRADRPETTYDPVDIPLTDNPEPAPESRPEASRAMSDGIIAPPASEVPPSDEVTAPLPHPSEPTQPGTAEAPTQPGTAAAAAAGAVAGAAVGAAASRMSSGQDGADPEPADPEPAGADPEPEPEPERTDANMESDKPAASRPAGNPWAEFGGNSEPDEHAGEVFTAYPSARPGPAGAIHGVGITVLVTNLDRSIEFYRDVLGFFEIDSGDASAVLASGDTRLVLRAVHNLAAEAGRLIYLNLEVGDVQAVHDELVAKGVKFVHTPRAVNRGDKLELWSATFRDPDNHNIAITQWRAIH